MKKCSYRSIWNDIGRKSHYSILYFAIALQKCYSVLSKDIDSRYFEEKRGMGSKYKKKNNYYHFKTLLIKTGRFKRFTICDKFPNLFFLFFFNVSKIRIR